MKIYPKILLSVLPMIIITGLGAYILTATLLSGALINKTKDLLTVELNRALSVTENYNQLQTQYGLENVSANVRQAQFDATAELKEMDIGENEYVMAVDQQGMIVLHPDAKEIGKYVNQAAWFQKMQVEKTGWQTFNFQNVSYLAEYRYFPDWGWYMLTVEPEMEVMQPIRQAFHFSVLSIVLIAGLALALLAWLTKRILQPLLLISNGAEQIGQGDYDIQMPVSSRDEIGNLASVFNRMAAQIKEHIMTLHESEERYSSLFNQAADGIFISDLDGNYTDVNESGCQMLGYTRAEILQMNVRDLATPKLNPEPIRFNELRAGQVVFAERRLLHHDGYAIPVELSARMIGNDRIKAAVRDITQRKYSEEALRESEEKYRLLLENSMDAILLTAPDGRILSANQAACRMFGYDETELTRVGRTLIIDVTDPRLEEALAERERTGRFQGELTFIHNGGTKFPGEISSVVFTDRNGQAKTSMIIRDVTQRKQVEAALRESEEKYRSLIEQLPAIVYVDRLDGKGTNLFISPQVESIFGVSMKEWRERDDTVWSELIHPEDRQEAASIYYQLKEVGQPYDIEYRVITRDGRLVWIHDKGEVLKSDTGELIMHGVMFDITALKQRETERDELLNVIEVSLNEIYMFDPDTLKFQYVNHGAMLNLGYSLEQLKTMTPLDIKPEFTEISFRKMIEPMTQNEQEKIIFPTVHQRSDASLYPVEVHLQLVKNPHRRVFLAVILDITERRQTEEALRIAEQDYRSIFENASIGIYRSTPEGRFLKVNSTMAEIFGYASPDEMIHSVINITKQLYVEVTSRERFQNLIKEYGEVLNLEYQNLRKDGSVIWISNNARAVRDETGEILYYEGFVSDITARKQAEEALEESEEKFRTAFMTSPDAININRLEDGRFVSINQGFTQIMGYTEEDVLGKTSLELQIWENPDNRLRLVEQLRRDGFASNLEAHFLKKDGKAKWGLMSASIIVLDGVPHVLSITRDITERKQTEQQILQLTRLYATLSQVNQSIVRVKTQQELFENICKVAVQFGEFRLAWIGLLEAESGEVIRAAQAGESTGYIEKLRINIHDPQLGNGPTAKALRFGIVQIMNDIEINGLMAPWRENAKKYNLRSSAALPLHLNGKVIGTLNLYSAEPSFFTQSEQQLLGEMGLDISFALDKIQTAEEHKQAVEKLRQNEVLYRSVFSVLNEGLVVQDTNDQILAANDSAAHILGLTTDQLLGKNSYDPRWMATHEDDTPFQPEDHPSMVTIKTGQPVDNTIMKVNIGDGSRAVISINSRPIHDENGDVSGVAVSFSDITERRQAEMQIQQQLNRMSALHMIDIAITSSFDLKTTLNIVLQQTISQMNVDACAILLFNPQTQTIEYAASHGFYSSATQHTKLRVSEGYAGHVVLERNSIHITDLMNTPSKLTASLRHANESFSDYFGIPLIVKGEVKGVLELYHRSPLNPDSGWLNFLEAISAQTAIAIDNAQLFGSLQRSKHELEMAYDATIQGWSHALDLRDKETEGHTQRVTDLTLKLAQAMGIPDEDLIHIRRGALLHDIGKMGVSDNILLKAGTLTDKEWKQMRRHPEFAHDMLSEIRYLYSALDIPYNHHEKWDGSGYPRGLKDEEIPLAARIFAVADVWDALTSDRPYRKAWTKDRTLNFIKEQSGRHFDPRVVEAFLKLIN